MSRIPQEARVKFCKLLSTGEVPHKILKHPRWILFGKADTIPKVILSKCNDTIKSWRRE